MRVLTVGNMYPPHHFGGYELMWRSSVTHLRGCGEVVRVLTTDYRGEVDRTIPEDADVHRELRWYWRDHQFPWLSPRRRLRLERHNLAVLEHHIREFRPDALAWWAMGGMSLSLLEEARRRGMPSVAVVVDDWLLYGPKVDQWQRLARRAGPFAAVLERFAAVPSRIGFDDEMRWVFVSETLLGHARAGGWRLPRATVAPAGIDRRMFPARPPAPWRGRLLYLGRLDRRKGVDVAVRAVASLPDATLTILGGGDDEYLRELRSLAGLLDLGTRVSFERRPRSQVPAAFAEADVVIFPVLWEEPWGLVPLEAMATGVPVIATGTGGSGEYLRDNENCLIYSPPHDPGALAAAVKRLAGDEALRARLRKGGLATATRLDEKSFNREVATALEREIG